MSAQAKSYDIIGVGFGPANLAIAIAMQEDARLKNDPLNCCFIEKQDHFEWHGGMLLDNTDMQVSFLKDLATLRNPGSHYSFINYLHQQGRLESFINLGTFFPSRLEYNDYMGWAAKQFDELVRYSEEVVEVEPVEENGQVEWLRVISERADGTREERFTRNLVVSIGGYAHVPDMFKSQRHERIIHSSSYARQVERFDAAGDAPHLAVIGAGQSAAEIFTDLMERYPNGRVDLISRSLALQPADDSPFVNEIFNPDFTDTIYCTPDDQRAQMLSDFSNTNYAVVDLKLIEDIYHRLYLQRVTGVEQHRYLAQREICDVKATEEHIYMTLRHLQSGEQAQTSYDGVILATGYKRDGHRELLSGLEAWTKDGVTDRCYRLPMQEDCQAAIYLQGCCEDTHGISDSLLSVLAVRSKEVVDSIYDSLQPEPAMEQIG